MRHQDWGSGEGGPSERQPIAAWDGPAEPLPVYGNSSSARLAPRRDLEPSDALERYRTPSRRRAIERGQREPVDTYLPRWALESGVRRADGGGRHAAPDDDDGVEPRGEGWREGGGWRWESDRRELPALGAGPAGEPIAEWTLDTPQEQGYVGSRRAESIEDEPVSGAAPWSRPRRARSRQPQVTWSGLEGGTSSDGEADAWDAGRPARRSRPPAAESWSRPPVDPWERGRAAEPDPLAPPAVDPWDASGVHAWDRPPTGRWDQAAGIGPWDRTGGAGRWDQAEGRWDRTEHTGEWDRFPGRGQWDRYDDPRWVETLPSAPRSPAVAYTAPRPRTPSRRRVPEPLNPGGGGASALRRRPEAVGGGVRSRRIEDDLLDPDPAGPARSLAYTAACYLVPALVVFVGLLFLDGRAPAGCVTDITGGGCDSPRAHAFASLVAGTPRFGLALLSSLVVAVVLRRVGTTWPPGTVALAAAVVGGGLSTVLISAVTGQPIG